MGVSQPVKDVLSGTAGGISQVFVGQPFDIVKVRLQTAPEGTYKSVLDCAKQILAKEGPLAFYKGSTTPLLGAGACVSIQFGVVEEMKRLFTRLDLGAMPANAHDAKALSGLQLYLCGAVAGVANAGVASPVEHLRIRLQAQSALHKSYAGPWDALRQIYAAAGLRGVMHGLGPSMLREAHGLGVYFWTYEELVRRELGTRSRSELSSTSAMLYGGTAGLTLWMTVYPLDVIKSRMQTDAVKPSERKFHGMADCARAIWSEAGYKGFIRGLTPTLIRAPFVNAASFATVEWAQRQMLSW